MQFLCGRKQRDRPNKEEEATQTIQGVGPNPFDLPPGCRFGPRCRHAPAKCRVGPIALLEAGYGHLTRCISRGMQRHDPS